MEGLGGFIEIEGRATVVFLGYLGKRIIRDSENETFSHLEYIKY